ncbi:COG0553: Superfamily II DNA/RNA helicases, SNF2 family [Thermobrachium celere DSM 8682]|uniref:COG0553: Superfamily II DNA/RNA helicases, SNF2 family n=2 Tax=Thermobrachium TaxID=150333 RepID=R7RQ91_9CLOT|nr:COG0553: Superfamily II DNA/RNA helicases, SNF2 family [Thermobrachium celere DSM 8682]
MMNYYDFLENVFNNVEVEYLKRGKTYYEQGRVKDFWINTSDEAIQFIAEVEGNEAYQPYIIIRKKNQVTELTVRCDCPFFKKYKHICKHITALYYYVIYNKDKIKPLDQNEMENNFIATMLINFLNQKISYNEKLNLNVEYTIEFNNFNYLDYDAELTIKVGFDKLYVVKNVASFLESIDNSIEYEFSKNFVFNPLLHDFKQDDRKIFEYLSHIYYADTMKRQVGYHLKGENVIFSGKKVYLKNNMVRYILENLKDRTFNVKFGSNEYTNVRVEFENIPFKIELEEKNGDIILGLNKEKNPIKLNSNGDLYLLDNKLYVLDNKGFLCYAMNLMIDADTIKFTGELKENLLISLPKLLKCKGIELKGELKNRLIESDLKSEIYIDKYKKGIRVDVVFKYGKEKINPLSKHNISPFIIRNYETEVKILDILNQSGFRELNNFYVLEDEGRIYMFLKHVLPVLKSMSEIFYTDSVKKIYKDKNVYATTKIKNVDYGLVEIEFNISDVDKKEIVNVLKSIKEKKNYHKLKSGEFISLEEKSIEQVKKILDEFDETEIVQNRIDIPKYRAISLLNKIDKEIEIEGRIEIDNLLNKIKNVTQENIDVPENLKNVLRDYQVTGFKWLKLLSNIDLGGILADDMGLGKTLQTIALIESEKTQGKTLIVVPSSLLFNWQSEFEKFAPDTKVLVVQGNKKKREELVELIDKNDVIITSYPLIRRDIELYENFVFNICILDEAQHIKNPESLNARSVKKIKSRVKFALTGTPIENNLIELWSIFDFILPGILYTRSRFIDKYEKPILKDNSEEALNDLKKTISPFILRRKKSDVLLELPDKIETKLVCEMTKKQSELYKAYLFKAREDVEKLIKNGEFSTNKIHVLKLLTRLRQICCHPSLFLENYKGDSGKLNQFEELIEELLEGGHRVLVFSQFVSLLDLVKKILDRKRVKYSYLDGSTELKERKVIVDEFNSGKTNVFLLSLKAGGTGLNLATADTVIHLDPWWNPAVEEQAADRAHRMGQKNVVQVFKMITKDSIEEKIYDLQYKKKELIDSVIKEGEVFINSLSEKEILEILK